MILSGASWAGGSLWSSSGGFLQRGDVTAPSEEAGRRGGLGSPAVCETSSERGEVLQTDLLLNRLHICTHFLGLP